MGYLFRWRIALYLSSSEARYLVVPGIGESNPISVCFARVFREICKYLAAADCDRGLLIISSNCCSICLCFDSSSTILLSSSAIFLHSFIVGLLYGLLLSSFPVGSPGSVQHGGGVYTFIHFFQNIIFPGVLDPGPLFDF